MPKIKTSSKPRRATTKRGPAPPKPRKQTTRGAPGRGSTLAVPRRRRRNQGAHQAGAAGASRGNQVGGVAAIQAAELTIDGNGLSYQAALAAVWAAPPSRCPDLISIPTGLRQIRKRINLPMVTDSVTGQVFAGVCLTPRTKSAYRLLTASASGVPTWGASIDLPGQTAAEATYYGYRVCALGQTYDQTGPVELRGGSLSTSQLPGVAPTDLATMTGDPYVPRIDGVDVHTAALSWRPVSYDRDLDFSSPSSIDMGARESILCTVYECGTDVGAAAELWTTIIMNIEVIMLPTLEDGTETADVGSTDAAAKAETVVEHVAGSMSDGPGPAGSGGGGGPTLDQAMANKSQSESVASQVVDMAESALATAGRVWGAVEKAGALFGRISAYLPKIPAAETEHLLRLHFAAVGRNDIESSPYYRSPAQWREIRACGRGSGSAHVRAMPRLTNLGADALRVVRRDAGAAVPDRDAQGHGSEHSYTVVR